MDASDRKRIERDIENCNSIQKAYEGKISSLERELQRATVDQQKNIEKQLQHKRNLLAE